MKAKARRAAILLMVLLLGWQLPLQAIESVRIQLQHWATETLSAQDLQLSFQLNKQGLGAKVQARQLMLAAPLNRIENVVLNCPVLSWSSERIYCKQATLVFEHKQLGKQSLQLQGADIQTEAESYRVDIRGLQLAEGDVDAEFNWQSSQWQLKLTAGGVELNSFSQLITDLGYQLTQLNDWQYKGKVSTKATLTGQDTALESLKAQIRFADTSFSNASGSQVAEAIAGQLQLDGLNNKSQWDWQTRLNIDAGQTYFDPVFLDTAQSPLSLQADGQWDTAAQSVNIRHFAVKQQNIVSVQGGLTADITGIQTLTALLEPAALERLYPVWIQPFLLGTAADKLDVSGQLSAELEITGNDRQLELHPQQVVITDQAQRFSVSGLNGNIAWSTGQVALPMTFSWQQARLYAMEIGAVKLQAVSQQAGLSLTEALNVPILDGKLAISHFDLQQDAEQQLAWSLDGLLTPITMESLSQALDWPVLHGKLSGIIPRVSYRNKLLEIDGALQVKVFDGNAIIRDLQVRSPLGVLPQLSANIDIDDIDLDLLTKTFDFGRISGRLSGYVHNLRLSNWQPVQFDAYLATPEDNPGKRRVSQRAVDNLSQIGSGATGLLSTSFLRFFDDFAYQKLGIACKLRNETCEMSGIGEAEQGYYIVKGGGGLPPWINVVGYTRQVDWSDLLARLKAVSNSSGPVIE